VAGARIQSNVAKNKCLGQSRARGRQVMFKPTVL